MDKGLRQKNIVRFLLVVGVSILGLVDKGLRHENRKNSRGIT